MNTILVPTDFSDSSINAGKYAFSFASRVGATKVVLYHTYSDSSQVNYGIIPADPMLLNEAQIDFEHIEKIALNGLEHFKSELNAYCPPNMAVELIAKYGFLTDDIKTTQNEVGADIIIMSITGGGLFTESVIGSDAVVVARQSNVPVLIIPPHVSYKEVNNILLVSDFEDVMGTVPTSQIKNMLDATKGKLNILHLSKENSYPYNQNSEERYLFESIFDGYTLSFHFMFALSFADGINDFSRENNMDIVVIIPKKHSLLESLFVKSHTKELAFHSQLPVMVVHS